MRGGFFTHLHYVETTMSETTMTNHEAVTLFSVLNTINNIPGNPAFAFAVAHNKAKLKPLIEAVTAAQDLKGDALEFQKKRNEAANQYAVLDGEGKPMRQGTQVMIRDIQAYEQAIESLKAESPEQADAWQKQQDEIKALLEEHYEDFDSLRRFNFKHLPRTVTPELMSAIFPLIEGEPADDETTE